MIADPLFYQRLSRALNLRGLGPEVPIEVLGAVISLDARALLERLSDGSTSLIPGESPYWGGGALFTQIAVVGELSIGKMVFGRNGVGPFAGGEADKRHVVSLMYLTYSADLINDTFIRQERTAGAGTAGTDYSNLGSGATNPRGRYGLTGGSQTAAPTFLLRLPRRGANEVYEYNGLASGVPLVRRTIDIPGDDWLEVRVAGTVNNTAMTTTMGFVVRLDPI